MSTGDKKVVRQARKPAEYSTAFNSVRSKDSTHSSLNYHLKLLNMDLQAASQQPHRKRNQKAIYSQYLFCMNITTSKQEWTKIISTMGKQ